MRKTLLNPVFLICLLLGGANQILEKGFGVYIPIVHSYLDDLVCFPIVLTLGLAAYRFFKPDYRLTIWHMMPVLLVYSVYFEVYLPSVSEIATADVFDVIMYFCGLTVFGYFINHNDAVGLKRTKTDLI